MAVDYAAGFIAGGGLLRAPTVDGEAGQVVQTDGDGNLAFTGEPTFSAMDLADAGKIRFLGGSLDVWLQRVPDEDHEQGIAVCGSDARGGKIAVYGPQGASSGIGTDEYTRFHVKKSSLSGGPWALVSRSRKNTDPVAVPIEIRITKATTDTGSGDVNARAVRIEESAVGIFDTEPSSRLSVGGGDVEVNDNGSGLVLKSPDGARWRITIGNDGALEANSL